MTGPTRLHLSVTHDYEVIQFDDVERSPYKVRTLAYRYHVFSNDHAEVMLYHWHPGSVRSSPHLHIGSAQLNPSGVLTSGAHYPTGRIAFEVLRLLVTDLGVTPRRTGWTTVLDECQAQFEHYRTWPTRTTST